MMKLLILLALTISSALYAETFKLPQGMTFRAHADGFDCGTFGPESDYVAAPLSFSEHQINLFQLAADKELNYFLLELTYPGLGGELCTYGAFFDRSRETRRLNLTHSALVSYGASEDCTATQEWLNQQLASISYEPSKRGIRYIALTLIEDESNDVCESRFVRAVFDRR